MQGDQAQYDESKDMEADQEWENPRSKPRGFDPRKYLVNLNGKGEYLEVKWRLMWLRSEEPQALIETELVRLEDRDAVFKARITLPSGAGATGWGSESAGDFRDFLEKAETKAIGRALAALGYGTQFCNDHDFGVGEINAPNVNVGNMRIVDAPVDLATTRGRTPINNLTNRDAPYPTNRQQAVTAGRQREETRRADDQGMQAATERQIKFIGAIANEAGLDDQELATWCQELYGTELQKLNRRDASALIEALQRRRNEVM